MEARSQLRHRPTRGERRIFNSRAPGHVRQLSSQNWNISRRSPDMLLRAFKLARPQFHWINLKMETWSIWTCEMKPRLAKGEITIMGTRTPRPWLSSAGGATWSYQPPPSSQMTMMAEFGQAAEFCTD